ncbi:MAG: ATP cone domain-containing protein [Planctomycetota bacterium]
MRKIEQVRKRDGRVVSYDEAKIAGAIFKAAQAVGGEDRYLSTELARVVTMFLERYYAKDVPEIEDIHDMVEKVLIETGHARTAKAYILYRVNKARRRERPRTQAAAPPLLVIDPASREAIQPWERERLRRSLERDGACPAQLSAEVARAVEERLLASGLRRVAPSLVREFAANLLFERGLLPAPAPAGSEAPDGVFESVFRPAEGGVRTPAVVAREVGERCLARFAREHVYLPDVVAAHQEGRIHLWPYEEPLRVDTLPLPREGDPAERATWLAEHVAGGLIASASAWTREGAARLRDVLAGMRQARHVVRIPAGMAGETALGIAEAAVQDGALAVEVVLTPADLADTGRVEALSRLPGARLLFERAIAVPAVAQGAALDLARLASEGDGEEAFFRNLDGLLAVAVRAHLDRRDLVRRLSSGPGLPLSGLCVPGRTGLADGQGQLAGPFPDGMAYAVVPCGLAQAVSSIVGREMHDDEGAQALGLRVAAWLDFRLKEESQRNRIRLVLSAEAPSEALDRFTASDGGQAVLAGGRVRRGAPGDVRSLARIEGRFHSLFAGSRLLLDPASWPCQGPSTSPREFLAWAHGETSAAGAEWTVRA